MSTQYSTAAGSKSAEEVQREMRQSRAEVEATLDAIQEHSSPGELFDYAVDHLKGGGTNFWRNLATTVRDNPFPIALLGTGLAWLMLSSSGSRSQRYHDEQGTPSGAERATGVADAAREKAEELRAAAREALARASGTVAGEGTSETADYRREPSHRKVASPRVAARIAYEAALYEAALEEGYRRGLASTRAVVAEEPDMIDMFRSAQIDGPSLQRPKLHQPRANFRL